MTVKAEINGVKGTFILDTGAPVTVPVGTETLGRVFNMVGETIDGLAVVLMAFRLPARLNPRTSE